MKNLINKLTFEFVCPNEDLAFGLRHSFSQKLQTELEHGIDSICSKHTLGSEAVRINKLALDLGQFNSSTFDKHIIDIFLSRFEDALLIELADLPNVDREHSRVSSQIDTLIHFLVTGQKPWWESNNLHDLNNSFIKHFKEDDGRLIKFLKNQANNTLLWRRISMQFNAQVHHELIAKIPELLRSANWIFRAVAELSEIFELQTPSKVHELINKLVIASRPGFTGHDTAPKEALRLLIANINMKHLLVGARGDDQVIIARIAEALVKENLETYKKSRSQEKPEIEVHAKDQDKYLSDQGGAVILSQFLKPLFKNLKLFIEGEWTDPNSQLKAVHLVHYLCTGEVTCPEYNLNIEKLLCGLPLNAPVPINADLTATEMKEADLLLESVVEHWGALKNTSVNGLRETFLLRKCIITENDAHWYIKIERKTLDVLLDKIPWGYSLIILPWNHYQINVEW